MTEKKEQVWTFHYPAPEPKPLVWMSGKNIETEEAAQKTVCEVFRRGEGEYFIEHEKDTCHTLLSGDFEEGSCACSGFKDNLPCVHLFALRKTKLTIKNITKHQLELIKLSDSKASSPFLTTAEKREAATTSDMASPPKKPPAPVAEKEKKGKVTCICKHCSQETTREQAEHCLDLMLPLLCPECEQKEDEKISRKTTRNGSEPQKSEKEPESLPPHKKPTVTNPEQSTTAPVLSLPPQKLIVGNCEAIARQYGIPSELANMYFMQFEGTAYIKNPGLLYLASKKGYSRIEIIDRFDEEKQEWSAECKVYPRLDARSISAIAQLKNEKLQEQALEYLMQPTNGTGRAGKHNVRMTTMHAFLREMAQTRAVNRCLRNFTGYGGVSREELPNAELEAQ